MAKQILVSSNDLLIMNLVHYFITEKNYNPVILHGINDEIWLENMDSDYKIIRIISHYIHNEEQLNYDRFKLKRILNNLKRKTFSLKMSVMSIYTNLGEDVILPDNDKNNINFYIKKENDISNKDLTNIFPDIVEKTSHKEDGIELFAKISEDINEKTYKRSVKIDKIFSSKRPIVTYIIMGICLVLFLLTYIIGNGSEDIETLLRFGANIDVLVKNGDYYRLLSCIFLHIGVVHIVLNMYSLYVIGPQIESFFGKFKFLIIYLLSGIAGSLLSICFSHNVVSAGASGAIFGLLGSLLYFGYYYRAYLGNALRSQILPVIFINLFIGFMINGVDNAAHIGGLVGGILTTMTVGIPEKSTRFEKVSGLISLIIYFAFLIYLGFFN